MRNFLLCLLCFIAAACQSKPPVEDAVPDEAPIVLEKSDAERREELRDVFKAHLNEISDCYDQTATGKRLSEGKVVMSVEIDRQGTVVGVGVKSSTLKPANKALEKCIGTSVAKYEFPPSRFDRRNVDFPFTFSALGRKTAE